MSATTSTANREGSIATPTAKPLAYLRRLANRAGTSFTNPKDTAQASAETERLKQAKSNGRTYAERDSPQRTLTGRDGPETRLGCEATASHSTQASKRLGAQQDAKPTVTDRHETAIIADRDRTQKATVSSTADEAAQLTWSRLTRHPTERQLAYLHKRERERGIRETHPATKLATSRRVDRDVQDRAEMSTHSRCIRPHSQSKSQRLPAAPAEHAFSSSHGASAPFR